MITSLAGGAEAIDLTEFIQEENDGTPLGQFASELLRAITQDRDVLLWIAKVLDVEPSSVKKALGWIGEKAARMKLETAPSPSFGMLEAL